MRNGPHLLLTLLLVVAGILVYEALRDDAEDPRGYAPMPSEPAPQQASDAQASSLADIEVFMREILARVERLEAELTKRRRLGGPSRGGDVSGAAAVGPATGSTTGAPLEDPLDLGGAAFDEKRLATLEAYLAEIARRKHVEVQRQLIESELIRQDLGLTPDEQAAVVASTLNYRNRVAELMRKRWDPGEKGRAQRTEAIASLRSAYRADIDQMVSADAVERIMNSSLPPAGSMLPGASGVGGPDR